VYLLLKEGVKVSVPDTGDSAPHPSPLPDRGGEGGGALGTPRPTSGGQKTERVRVIDWEHPANNDFLLVSQLSVTGALYTCRPDLVGFINGLPLVVVELKKPGVPARAAFDENLTHYKQQVPALFWYNSLLIASNGTDSRVGSLTADWGRFFEWKRVAREDEPRRVSLEVMMRGTCDKTRLLDLVETVMDLSKIDFEALRARFKESKHRNTDLEILKAAIRAQLQKLIRLNKTRADFQEKFEELIESYNAGSRNIEELFNELVKLSRSLSEEQQRHVRENMTEEELVIFDILTRPAPESSAEERTEVKKVARALLNRLKELLVLNWRQKAAARAQLRLAIEDVLDSGLPRVYSPALYQQKCSAVFEHVFESYPEQADSIYTAVS